MLKKKTKKRLKKLRLRMRMKHIQRIMNAIRIHQKITKNQKLINEKTAKTVSNIWAQKSLINRTNMLRGRISASRRRTKDLWLNRKRKPK